MKAIITKFVLVLFIATFISSCMDEPSYDLKSNTQSARLTSSSSQQYRLAGDNDPINDFEKYITGIKYYLWSPTGVDKPSAHMLKVVKTDYLCKNVPSEDKYVPFSVVLDVRNAYNLEEERNYYYLNFKVLVKFGDAYIKDTHSCNIFGTSVHFKATAAKADSGMAILDVSPKTSTSSHTVSTGLSYNIGGVVGYKAGADVEARPGISITTTKTEEIKDVTTINNSDEYTVLDWTYNLTPASSDTWDLTPTEGAAVGRSTFDYPVMAIISFPDDGFAPHLKIKADVTVNSYYVDFWAVKTCWRTWHISEIDVELPYISFSEAQTAADDMKQLKRKSRHN